MHTQHVVVALLLQAVAFGKPIGHQLQPRLNFNTSENTDLIEKLITAATAVDRLALITNDADFVYDFSDPPNGTVTQGLGGHTVKADRKAFPALVGTGVGMTVGFLGPCGFNTPHVHPRSSEFNIVVQGRLGTEFILENGARPIMNTLNQFQATVFPQGATHTEFNPDCGPAVFVAGFASEDPGVQQDAQTFFGLDPEIVAAALNVETVSGETISTFKDSIPANVASGVEACLKKCHINPTTATTTVLPAPTST